MIILIVFLGLVILFLVNRCCLTGRPQSNIPQPSGAKEIQHHNSIDDFLKDIDSLKDIVFINGTGASGKTELAKKLVEQRPESYHINLDQVVQDMINDDGESSYFRVYSKDYDNADVINKFVEKVRALIEQHPKAIIDGGLRNVDTIDKILDGYEYSFVYLRPSSKDKFARNVKARYESDKANNTKTLPFLWRDMPTEESEIEAHIVKVVDKEYEKIPEHLKLFEKYDTIVVED